MTNTCGKLPGGETHKRFSTKVFVGGRSHRYVLKSQAPKKKAGVQHRPKQFWHCESFLLVSGGNPPQIQVPRCQSKQVARTSVSGLLAVSHSLPTTSCNRGNEACRNQGSDSGVLDPVVHVKYTQGGTLFGKPEYAWIVTWFLGCPHAPRRKSVMVLWVPGCQC